MSERYSRLYALPGNLYAETSPVVIAAGALLKDNETGNVLAQLKLKSISDKNIKAVTVSISAFDTFDAPLGEAVSYQYLDMKAARDAEFGAKKAIFLPDATTRKFSAAVTSVAFADNSVWKASGAPWEPLSAKKELRSMLDNDDELWRQYRIKNGRECNYAPEAHRDLWYCACGALNHQKEANCHSCGKSFDQLRSVDLQQLRTERDERLAAEAKKSAEEKAAAEARERERKAAAEARAKAEKAAAEARAKKIKKIAVIVASVAAVAVAVTLLITKVIIPNGKYNDAVALMENGQYEEAIAAFTAMDGYKDSAAQIEACNIGILDRKYNDAVALMEAGQYDKAIAAFKALNGHKDSTAQIEACNTAILDGKYNDAVKLMDAGQYEDAIAAFETLDGHKDSLAQIEACNTAILDGKYNDAIALMNAGQYEEAIAAFVALDGYKDSAEQLTECNYHSAVALMNSGEAWKAYSTFAKLGDYKDSKSKAETILDEQYQVVYKQVSSLVDDGEYEQAVQYCNENWRYSFGTVSMPTELVDYHNYAAIMIAYDTGDFIFIPDYLAALKRISASFKDVNKRINRVQSVLDSYSGVWKREWLGWSMYVSIGTDGSVEIRHEYINEYIDSDLVPAIASGNLAARLKDGLISDVRLIESRYTGCTFELTRAGKLKVERWSKYSDGVKHSDVWTSGTYSKVG